MREPDKRPPGKPPGNTSKEVRFKDADLKDELLAVAKKHGDTLNNVVIAVLKAVNIEAVYTKTRRKKK